MINDEVFMQERLGKLPVDQEFEKYLDCWLAYHEAADRIDGHIVSPISEAQHKLVIEASRVAMLAMCKRKKELCLYNIDSKKWTQAKMAVLRRMKKQ